MYNRGCELCHQGAKMVVFVTGRCHRGCWYCPISADRSGGDAIFANDRRVEREEEILMEGETMSALGSSITGGEPLLVLDRVVRICGMLKEHFGRDHHIHLYTGMATGPETLSALRGVVDEIRMHPPEDHWPSILGSPFLRSVDTAREMGFTAGFEVPSLPGMDRLAPALPHLDFLNVNELEWGDISAAEMRRRGYVPSDALHNAVRGAHTWAQAIRKQPKVHWCTSASKDGIQLRERLKRIARNTARPFDEITEDGTVIYGVVEGAPAAAGSLSPGRFASVDDRLECSPRELRRIHRRIPGKKYIVERYPNRGVVVEVTPL